jgi:hypothetical protein
MRLPDDLPIRLGAVRRDLRPHDTRRAAAAADRLHALASFETKPHEIDEKTGKPLPPGSSCKAAAGEQDSLVAMLDRAAKEFGHLKALGAPVPAEAAAMESRLRMLQEQGRWGTLTRRDAATR